MTYPITDIQAAWGLASKLHHGQKYAGHKKGEEVEYLSHIGSVVFEVMAALDCSEGMDARLALLCAILHDTLEDTDYTVEQLSQRFGGDVAAGVMALTKDETLGDKRAMMEDSLARIRQQPPEVWAVKMADRICNLAPPPHYWTREKIDAYREEARLIHQRLKNGNAYLAQRLAEKIAAYG